MSINLEKLPSTIWILAAGLLCVGAGQSIVFITIPPIARDLGLNEIQIGSIFATSALAWMILSPIWGSLSDSVGRKKIVIVGLLGFAVSLILFSFTISLGQIELLTGSLLFLLLVAARVLNGIFGSATRPSSGGWVADISSTESRSRAFARLDSGFSMGRILGPAVAGLLLLVSYTAVKPPSSSRSDPVIKEDSSLARNTAPGEISSGRPRRSNSVKLFLRAVSTLSKLLT